MSDRSAMGRWLMIAASVVVLATLVAAIVAIGPPSVQRQIRLDDKRVQDLQRIVQVIDGYVQTHDSLPPDLATLARQPGLRLSIADPVDAASYGYTITGKHAYRLCAVFITDTANTPVARPWRSGWNHGVGRQCFDRQATMHPVTVDAVPRGQ